MSDLRWYDIEGRPITVDRWMRLVEDADARGEDYRRVALDEVGGTTVSTVLLGLDHRFDDGPPLIFETMTFSGPLEGEARRYSTREAALAGHAEVVTLVATALDLAVPAPDEEKTS